MLDSLSSGRQLSRLNTLDVVLPDNPTQVSNKTNKIESSNIDKAGSHLNDCPTPKALSTSKQIERYLEESEKEEYISINKILDSGSRLKIRQKS